MQSIETEADKIVTCREGWEQEVGGSDYKGVPENQGVKDMFIIFLVVMVLWCLHTYRSKLIKLYTLNIRVYVATPQKNQKKQFKEIFRKWTAWLRSLQQRDVVPVSLRGFLTKFLPIYDFKKQGFSILYPWCFLTKAVFIGLPNKYSLILLSGSTVI